MAKGEWRSAAEGFALAIEYSAEHSGVKQESLQQASLQQARAWHNLGVCFLGLGEASKAIFACEKALHTNPSLLQSLLVMGKAKILANDPMGADTCYSALLKQEPAHPQARIARADLLMNTFGQPKLASDLVGPLLELEEYKEDATLTQLMAGLYDRDTSAQTHNARVIGFSKASLRLTQSEYTQLGLGSPMFSWTDKRQTGESSTPAKLSEPSPPSLHSQLSPLSPHLSFESARKRPLVGLISPMFTASPVYFLTISAFKEMAKTCDLVIFNRGHKKDWATDKFIQIASECVQVQEMSALNLAQTIYSFKLDVLYDLGGWMDPIALKALSVKPARHMFKWVGGQSVTTGLESFDGWIGDAWQSPLELQHLYTEPLLNIGGQHGYATYTPPPYMPVIPNTKRDVPVIFANPAKLSDEFLKYLKNLSGLKSFVHQQFKYPLARERVLNFLDPSEVEFITPNTHKEALEILGQYTTMIDTFPYSGGLTAREARAMGVKVISRVGTLFCERHCAQFT